MAKTDAFQMTIAAMERTRKNIVAGKSVGKTGDLIVGQPFCRNDPRYDAQKWFADLVAHKDLKLADPSGMVERALSKFAREHTAETADAARQIVIHLLEKSGDTHQQLLLEDIALRLDIYAADQDYSEAAARMTANCLVEATRISDPIRRAEAHVSAAYYAHIAAWAEIGVSTVVSEKTPAFRKAARERAEKAIAQAAEDFKCTVEVFNAYTLRRSTEDVIAESLPPTAEEIAATKESPPTEEEGDDLSFLPRYQPLGLAELSARFHREKEVEFKPHGITVVGALHHLPADSGKNGGESIRAQFKSLEKRHIPLIECAAPAGVYADLTDRFPWAEGAIETIVKEVGRRDFVRIRPTMLVGPPGSGKTKLAMELARALGLQPTKFSCAGVSDSSFAGTSRQWSTVRASVPLQAIQRSMIANPAIVLDEIEKTATGNQNGSLVSCLLDFLERGSAKAIFDPALECPVDLSGVVYIATANSLGGLPAALANRFRILQVPAPGIEHLEELCRSILDDHAAEEEIDRRWIPDLDGDELAAVRSVWKGGSIRPLRAAIEATLQAREEFAPRM